MSAFTFDTSGTVRMSGMPYPTVLEWPDLSPFVRGYVEAMFRSMVVGDWCPALIGPGGGTVIALGYRHLAPETLTRIMEDCERFSKPWAPASWAARMHLPNHAHWYGKDFWTDRQNGNFPTRFPPLTPYLGDDGKVRLDAR